MGGRRLTASPPVAAPSRHGWSVVGASVAGTAHVAKGIGSDDAFFYTFVAPDIIVAAVADGAGSRSGTSAFGSFAACEAIRDAAADPALVERVRGADADELSAIAVALFRAALAAIEAAAAGRELTPSALATTLTVGVVTPELSVFGQVGDGIVVIECDGVTRQIIPEIKGEYANETQFLTAGALRKELRIEVRQGVGAFALSTDGLRYKILRLSAKAPFEPFFDSLWGQLSSKVVSGSGLAAMLDGIVDDQTGDDKTLIIGSLASEQMNQFPGEGFSSAAPPDLSAAGDAAEPDSTGQDVTDVSTDSIAQEVAAPSENAHLPDPDPADLPDELA